MKLADGYEKAFIGTTISAFGRKQVALYDYDKCIMVLMNDNNWDEEEAIEWFNFNTIGSWVGEDTPIFVNMHKLDVINDFLEDDDE
jgi:hypothetical protein|tara:strand:- start:6730 stop:6987 length:258 start_codon:yes stop_codon:yes gene_type:complete